MNLLEKIEAALDCATPPMSDLLRRAIDELTAQAVTIGNLEALCHELKDRPALADREWRPIETAPKNKDRVLIFSEKRGVRGARFYHENSDGNVWYDTMVGGGPMTLFYDATHWKPMPKPPIDLAMREGGEG